MDGRDYKSRDNHKNKDQENGRLYDMEFEMMGVLYFIDYPNPGCDQNGHSSNRSTVKQLSMVQPCKQYSL